MSNKVTINPKLYIWARNRAAMEFEVLQKRFPKLPEWESGESHPTLRQLENFANAVHVPVGYLFLPEPVVESLPITDFRTLGDQGVAQPSPDLLDTLYLCQQRQEWFRDYARTHSLSPLDYIGSVEASEDPVTVAEKIRSRLNILLSEVQLLPNWTEALKNLIAKAEESGILIMASSIVGSNSHRKLKVEEFRGLALVDDLAPLVFLNASDSKSAQIFTLAHELVHLWLGKSGVFDTEAGRLPEKSIERWCNAVAAELLVPLSALKQAHEPSLEIADEIQRLARRFKVSTLVVLRRLFDAGLMDQTKLWTEYRREVDRLSQIDRSSGGGDFYRTLGARIGKRFARAVLSSTLEGQTLFQDAFRMLGVKKSTTFYQAARELKVMV